MLLKRSFINTFKLATLMIVVSACVPKATEKKAVCGENEAFSTVTRSCYSIEEQRYKPVGTKSSDTLAEETPKTITLTYTDANKDQAVSCKVSAISSNIEAISPLLLNNGLENKAADVYAAFYNLANSIPVPDTATAATYRNNMLTAFTTMRTSFSQASIDSAMTVFVAQATNLLTLATNHPSETIVQNYYVLGQTMLQEFAPIKTQVNNRCECSAGVCTTTISPKLHKSGSAGFSYTVTDVDGESATKAVSLTISPISTATAYLQPVAKSLNVTGAESNTSTPTGINFTIPAAGDINSTAAANFQYTFVSSPKGTVTNCMNLAGSTNGKYDTTCTYTPTDGDAYTTSTPAAATVTINGDITYTAVANGIYGNNISIQYFDLQDSNSPFTKAASFGLISSYQESFVRVNGDAISIYLNLGITTAQKVADLINNHPQANKLVSAAVVAGHETQTPSPTSTPSAVSLAGGVNAYDTITYRVSNGISSSTNTGTIQINVTSTNDLPMVGRDFMDLSVYAPSTTFREEKTNHLVTIDLQDVDSYASAMTINAVIDENLATSTTCPAITTAGMLLLTPNSKFIVTPPAPAVATCDTTTGKCTATVRVDSLLDFYGNVCLYYSVTDSSGATSVNAQGVFISVTGVNDAPLLSETALALNSPSNAAVTLVSTTNMTINEDLASPSTSFKNIYVRPSGDKYEASELTTVTLNSSVSTLVPNVACLNYKPGTTTPVNNVTASVNAYYFDITNLRCYVGTGTTSADWKLYPSLTAYPADCNINVSDSTTYGAAVPSVATTIGKHYLNTLNNKCYIYTSSGWELNPAISNYKISYVPATDKSGTTNITVTVQDNGGTDDSGVDTRTGTFQLTVTSVDDPPVFRSFFTSIQTNEGGDTQSAGFVVDEDDGSTADEDNQQIRITALTSDNTNVLPISAISIFYDLNDNGVEDAGEARPNTLASGTPTAIVIDAAGVVDVSAHKIYFKLDPVDGVSGNANIGVTISDGGPLPANSVTKTFSFIVHPIAALHGGWNNISSVGLKTDKNGAPVAEGETQCNYNLSTDTQKCGTNASCTGTSTPHSTIIPTAAGVIFWDSSNKRCYRSTSNTEYSWVDLKTSCPVTRKAGVNSGENYFIDDDPTNSLTPSFVGQYVLDTVTNKCYVSTGVTDDDWQEYVPAKVTLAWKPFTLVGSGPESGVQIAGWNVYRREKDTDYDFKGGHLKNTSSTSVFTITDPSVRTYTDTTAVAGKVYYYVVRPVDNRRNFPTYTSEIFSEVRVLAAPANYSFVHRWIVNQEMCNGMNITTGTTPNHVDQTSNFRCEYSGPGSTGGYYDYGRDLLVDTQEMGCAYAPAPACTSNGCIGVGAPNNAWATTANELYYSRSTGICYRSTGSSSWEVLQSSATPALYSEGARTALNPPLVNVTKDRAMALCAARAVPTTAADMDLSSTSVTLPNKKDYIAYASHKISITDPEITEMEQGFSLNVQSRCNGSAASGLETAYTDSAIPSTSFIYSLPGTASSNIRSLYTGSIAWGSSKGTEACVSRFGIQDLYGNVAEWVNDGMNCSANISGSTPVNNTKVCTAKTGGTYSFTATDFAGTSSPTYAFNNIIGPFSEGGDGIINASTTSLILANDAVDTSLKVAIGGIAGFPSSGVIKVGNELMAYSGLSSDATGGYFTGLSRGYSGTTAANHASGATVEYYSDDSWLTNWTFSDQLFGATHFIYPLGLPVTSNLDRTNFSAYLDWILAIGPSSGITTNKLHEDGIIVNGSAAGNKNFAVGGSYLSGNRAGRFSSELIDSTVSRADVGFRCVIPVDDSAYDTDSKHTYPY
ncbi:hypothetical protein C0V70_10135 [Bacteriovorax stolpii]|uniref:Uncharacterized protein n=1 Tax=Bacteriovorax stolpii TaxID=960 RepID=A0A2K9NSF8_BACTC|nr:hypothetical protein [Bacteriovorax stolpii]AUN98456.1 hypothetical protein C0V70_10135 [Bacteriovorax stolpii]TDP50919.1 hypothetical protein C8D79_3657 [Bacteriovorax stolpii]